MSKLVIFTNNSDGLYGFRGDLIRKLTQKNQVTAAMPDNGFFAQLSAIGCKIVEISMDRRGLNPIKDFGLFLRYWNLLRRERPDLVITYTIKPNIYGGLACRLLGIPNAANVTGLGTAFQHDGLLRKLVTTLYKPALKKARVVLFENSANRQVFLDAGIVPEEKTCLLSGAGVNLEHYGYVPYPEEQATRFLFIGRVMKEKGIEELFAAMERLHSEGFDCCLDVLGGYEEHYEETIRRCEAQGWLNYHGYVMDVRPYIEKSHCFVLPSYHEGMANTNLECAAMGRPLITSRIPGCREAVIEYETGLLCQPQDADSLYETMKHFLSLDDETRAQMGRMGRRHMEAVFDKKDVVARTVEALGLNRG